MPSLIWTLPRRKGPRTYLRQLIWAPTLAMFTIAVLVATRGGRWIDDHVPRLGGWGGRNVARTDDRRVYWWSQHWLLHGRVAWRGLLPAATAVGVYTTALMQVSRLIVPGQISWQVHAYGLVGGVFVLSVWLMILRMLIFAGVLTGALIAERAATRYGSAKDT
jgi:hypothetical protein